MVCFVVLKLLVLDDTAMFIFSKHSYCMFLFCRDEFVVLNEVTVVVYVLCYVMLCYQTSVYYDPIENEMMHPKGFILNSKIYYK